MSIIKFAVLKIPFGITSMQKEVEALQKIAWHPHINRSHYEGKWDVLSLRSPGGNDNTMADALNNEEYADTSLMKQCPSIHSLVNSLQCDKFSVRLLSLHPGAIIKEHTDKELYFEKGETRLHFPVFTNADVEFYLDNTRLQMKEGECWYINANLPHRLANKGTSNRIHLVIDCKVNNWLRHLFQNDFIQKEEISDTEVLIRDKNTIEKTIAELRRQTNQVALDLADKLDRQLREAEYNYDAITKNHAPGIQSNEHPSASNESTDKIITFIRSIGITVFEGPLEDDCFLPGMQVKNGSLLIDKSKLVYPGDLLHEAGHIAVTPAGTRSKLNNESIVKSKDRAAEEMMAIAWSYAACIHLAIDPRIVFHENGYKGGGQTIIENFQGGKFFGTPMLQWCGMTLEPKPGNDAEKVFPAMIKWLRN